MHGEKKSLIYELQNLRATEIGSKEEMTPFYKALICSDCVLKFDEQYTQEINATEFLKAFFFDPGEKGESGNHLYFPKNDSICQILKKLFKKGLMLTGKVDALTVFLPILTVAFPKCWVRTDALRLFGDNGVEIIGELGANEFFGFLKEVFGESDRSENLPIFLKSGLKLTGKIDLKILRNTFDASSVDDMEEGNEVDISEEIKDVLETLLEYGMELTMPSCANEKPRPRLRRMTL